MLIICYAKKISDNFLIENAADLNCAIDSKAIVK